ncbi:hypothetical protein Tco_0441206 [Tanacetum coccineum]
MDLEVKQLRHSRVPFVKVRWNSKRGPEFTWEHEDQFKKKYPHLFTKIAPSSSAASCDMPRTLIPLRAILGVLQIGIKSQGYREPDTVMSDSEDSTVTYTAVSSTFEDRSNIGSPGVDGPPIMPEDPYAYIVVAYQAPPSPDYMPGPQEPQSPPPLDLVPKPMYPEYMPLEDERLPTEEQPLPAAASPTADSPGYVPEDDDDEEEEEEEHPAPVDFVPPVHLMTARISIRDEPSISLLHREEVERLLALTTPPPSPLIPLSSPLPQIPSPLLPASPPASALPASPSASPIRPLGYRATIIWLRSETPSTSHPLPTSSPPLQLLSSDRRADRPEITLPPQKRLGIDLGPRYEIGEGSSAAATRLTRGRRADYGFVGDTQDRQTQIYQRVETLGDDSQYHYKTTRLLDQEALVSQEAWGRSIEVIYMARSKIRALCSVVMGQQALISQLQAADRAACADFDIDAVTTRTGDNFIGTGDHFTGTGDSTAGTAGTLWRSITSSHTGGGR